MGRQGQALVDAIRAELAPLDTASMRLYEAKPTETRERLNDYTFTDEYDDADFEVVRARLLEIAGSAAMLNAIRNMAPQTLQNLVMARYEVSIKRRNDALKWHIDRLGVEEIRSIATSRKGAHGIIVNIQITTASGEAQRVVVSFKRRNKQPFDFYYPSVKVYADKYTVGNAEALK